MKGLEVWLCRVLLHPITAAPMRAQQLNVDSHQMVMAKIINGELGTLQDGTIVEPVTSHATEAEANEARLRKLHDEPGTDWRVVVTMQVTL